MLAGIAKVSPEELLIQIIDPNRKVEPRYLSYIVTLEDGQILTGIIAAESAAGVTLRRPGAVEQTVPRDQIDSPRSSGLSLMPENLEAGLTAQQMTDLLAFLRSADAKNP